MRKQNSQNWIPSIFNDFFDNDWMERANATAPAINVMEDDKNYRVEVAAPGMTKGDFDVHVEDDNLVISMERKTENKEDKKNCRYLRREFSYSKFQQTLYLPEDVEKDKIAAKVNDGVLTIDLPKREPQTAIASKRQIAIQ